MSKRISIRTALVLIGLIAVAFGLMANRASKFAQQSRVCIELEKVDCYLFAEQGLHLDFKNWSGGFGFFCNSCLS